MVYRSGLRYVDPRYARSAAETVGMRVAMPELQPDAFPFWGFHHAGVVDCGDGGADDRKYVENWLLWVIIDVISVVNLYAVRAFYARCRLVCSADGDRANKVLTVADQRRTAWQAIRACRQSLIDLSSCLKNGFGLLWNSFAVLPVRRLSTIHMRLQIPANNTLSLNSMPDFTVLAGAGSEAKLA